MLDYKQLAGLACNHKACTTQLKVTLAICNLQELSTLAVNYLSLIAAAESKLAIANFIDDKQMKGQAIATINKLKLEMRNYVKR